jgi:NADPH:quinone reductase-like Zn-dependent oxidoreductase
MQCIRFGRTGDDPPGAGGETLLVTDFFSVARRSVSAGETAALPANTCTALMILDGYGPMTVRHSGSAEPKTAVRQGSTVLIPAAADAPVLTSETDASWLEITLPTG